MIKKYIYFIISVLTLFNLNQYVLADETTNLSENNSINTHENSFTEKINNDVVPLNIDQTSKSQENLIPSSPQNKNQAPISENEYEKNIKDLSQVSEEDVKLIFSDKSSNHESLLYIGRPTCYYCRQFSPVLKEFNILTDYKLKYFNIIDYNTPEHDYAFNKIGIPGTPSTLRIKNGTVISAWIGGEINSHDLYNFLHSSAANTRAAALTVKNDNTNNSELLEENKSSSNQSVSLNSHILTPVISVTNDSKDNILDSKNYNKEYHFPHTVNKLVTNLEFTKNDNVLPKLSENISKLHFILGLIMSAISVLLMIHLFFTKKLDF